jgi:hypothetical protein
LIFCHTPCALFESYLHALEWKGSSERGIASSWKNAAGDLCLELNFLETMWQKGYHEIFVLFNPFYICLFSILFSPFCKMCMNFYGIARLTNLHERAQSQFAHFLPAVKLLKRAQFCTMIIKTGCAQFLYAHQIIIKRIELDSDRDYKRDVTQ